MQYRERFARLQAANELIEVIAGCGHRFFRHAESVARLVLDRRGYVFYVDHYTGAWICTNFERASWRGFTGGGTLRELITRLRRFVTHDDKLPSHTFDPRTSRTGSPCGDCLGYGPEAIAQVGETARRLNILAQDPAPNP